MLYVIILLSVLFFLFLLLLLSWLCRVEGNIYLHNDSLNYSGTVSFGGKNSGIGLSYQEGARYLFLGSTDNPLIRCKLFKTKKAKKEKATGVKSILEGWKKKKTIPVKRLISGIWKSITWETVGVSGEFGLNSPHITGQVFGAIMTIQSQIKSGIRRIQLIPDFNRKILNLNYHSSFRIRPVVLAWRIGSSFLSRIH